METYYNTLQDFYKLGQMYLAYMFKRKNPTNYDKCFGPNAEKPEWKFEVIAHFDDSRCEGVYHYANHNKVIGYVVNNGETRQIEFGNVIKIVYFAGRIEVHHKITPEQLSTLYKIAFETLKKEVLLNLVDDAMEDSIERDRMLERIMPGRENENYVALQNIREDELRNYITKEDYSNLDVDPWTFNAGLDAQYFESLESKDGQLPEEQPSPRMQALLDEKVNDMVLAQMPEVSNV